MEFDSLIRLIIVTGTSFFICLFTIPRIIEIANKKKLFDYPDYRTSHVNITPTLGGVGIMSAFITTFLFFIDLSTFQGAQYIIISLFILFMTGIYDDITGLAWYKKIMFQVIATLITIIFGKMYFSDLHGFFGIHQIEYGISIIITSLAFILIINAYNLIDGIDGLASGMGILALGTMGIWSYLSGEFNISLMSLSFAGSLAAFFYFNVFGRKNKLFMGDTGSMILGFTVTIAFISFNQRNLDPEIPFWINSSPAISIAIMFIPLYDVFRVFIIRIAKGNSPFEPDRNHLHHYLIDLDLKHSIASSILIFVNIILIVIAYLLKDKGIAIILLTLLAVVVFLNLLLFWRLKRKRSEINMLL